MLRQMTDGMELLEVPPFERGNASRTIPEAPMLVNIALLATLVLSDTGDQLRPGNDLPRVVVDTTATEIRVTVRGLRIPAAAAYAHAREERFDVIWPATGWLRGYRIDVVDSLGNQMPAGSLHHAGVANLDRRQLAYDVPERLVAAGLETRPFVLPGRLGIPVSAGQRLVAYFMLVNVTGSDLEEVAVRFSFPWTPVGSARRPVDVFPVFLNAYHARDGISFDVPPGRSETRDEFVLPVGGRMRVVGGHLHDFAEEIRLEEVETGRVLVRLRADKGADGTLRRLPIAKFPLTRGGLRLEANRRYRVVAVYDNPGCETLKAGAMALLAGPFAPDDVSRWPAVDPARALYLAPGVSMHRAPGEAGTSDHGEHHGHAKPRAACPVP
jgi:hypothetical protein